MNIKDKGARGIKGYTVVEKHMIADKIHEEALQQGANFKVMGMKILFEKLLKEEGRAAIEGHEQDQEYVIKELKELLQAKF